LSTLEPEQAHVWTLPVAQSDQKHIDKLAHVLCPKELTRLEQITHKQSKREYQAAHILCRLMLSHFTDVAPTAWRFEKGEYGRPEIDDKLNPENLRFNISHTNGLVACALTTGYDIGVDVEWPARSNMVNAIAEKKFSNSEFAYFQASPPTEQRRIFFSFWTLKEAYIKAIGKGLHEPLDSFTFDLDVLKIFFLRENDNRKSDLWSFGLFAPTQDHLCAICVARPVNASQDIRYKHLFWDNLDAP
jgi:4'-phosphopantetheinyl transferase